MATRIVRFSEPWTDPATSVAYAVGDVVALPKNTARQVLAYGQAIDTDQLAAAPDDPLPQYVLEADLGATMSAVRLIRTAVKTSAYTAAAGDLVPVDTATPNANVTVTLPAAPVAGARVTVKHVAVGAGRVATVACQGTHTFNKTSGATTLTLPLLNQAITVQFDGGIWTVVSDDLPKSGLDGVYAFAQTAGDTATPLGRVTSTTKTADYTLAVADLGTVVELNSATDIAVKLPSDATAVPVGSIATLSRVGAGKVLVAPEFQNYALNPSFEVDTTGWSARGTGATLARINNGTVKYGSWGGRVTGGAVGTLGFFYGLGTLASLGLQPGDKVSARLDMASPLGGCFVQLRFQTASSVSLLDVSGNSVTNGTSKIDGAVIPAGTDNILVMSFVNGTVGGTMDFDGLMVCKGPKAPAVYADPSLTAGMGWLGTAHASQSVGPTVRGALSTLPLYGAVRVRKRAAGEWVLEHQPADEVMLDTDVLVADRDNGQAGMYACSQLSSVAPKALTSNLLSLVRFSPSRAMLVNTIAFRVSTASGTDDPVECGIFDASGTKLAGSGSVTGRLNSTGTKTVTLTSVGVLAPGNVYYAYLTATSTATLQHVNYPGDLFGSAMPQAEMLTKATVAPGSIGSTVTGLTAADAAPLLVVR